MTSNNYLSHAGPLGSILGILIGALAMLIISKNYFYLMQRYTNAGGAYTYAKEVFGYDQGFLTGWFLALTYLSIFWANATSLPLFARFFFGNIFRFGDGHFLFHIFCVMSFVCSVVGLPEQYLRSIRKNIPGAK